MKESAFRTSVLRHIPAHIHAQPNPATFMSTAGTPDHYFDYKYDLWVEWKVMRQDNHYPALIPQDALPSEAQCRWLRRRWEAGGNAVVIVGIKLRGRAHGMVLAQPHLWETRLPVAEYKPLLVPASDLAAYITQRVTEGLRWQ